MTTDDLSGGWKKTGALIWTHCVVARKLAGKNNEQFPLKCNWACLFTTCTHIQFQLGVKVQTNIIIVWDGSCGLLKGHVLFHLLNLVRGQLMASATSLAWGRVLVWPLLHLVILLSCWLPTPPPPCLSEMVCDSTYLRLHLFVSHLTSLEEEG